MKIVRLIAAWVALGWWLMPLLVFCWFVFWALRNDDAAELVVGNMKEWFFSV